MDIKAIEAIFDKTWTFSLFKYLEKKKIPVVGFVIGAGLLTWSLGFLLALILGKSQTYVGNLMGIIHPFGLMLSLLAYHWYANNFPKYIFQMIPAIKKSEEDILTDIQTAADITSNNMFVMIGVSIFIGIAQYYQLNTMLNVGENIKWLGSNWFTAEPAWLFQGYFGFLQVIVMGFMLGSGLVGLIMTVFVFYKLFNGEVVLDYQRRLSIIGTASAKLSGWILLAIIFLSSAIWVVPVASPMAKLPSILLSAAGSLILFVVLFEPLIFIKKSIGRARQTALNNYEIRLHALSNMIEKLEKESDEMLKKREDYKKIEEVYKGQKFYRVEREAILEKMKLISEEPSWPVSIRGTITMIGTVISPPIGTVLSFTKIFGISLPDVLKNWLEFLQSS